MAAALNDTILRNILGDGTGPKKDWVSRNKDDPVEDYNKYLSTRAKEEGMDKLNKAEEKKTKGFVKGLKTFRSKGEGESKGFGGEEYNPSIDTETIVSGLETYGESQPKKTKEEKPKEKPKYAPKPVPLDVLRLIDPKKQMYPSEWKETEAAQPLSYKAKALGQNFMQNVKGAMPELENKFKRSVALSPGSETMDVNGVPLKVVEKPALTAKDVENKLAVMNYENYMKKVSEKEKYDKSFRGQFLNVVQSPGLRDFGANVSANLSTGMGSSIIGSFQDPKSGADFKRAQLQLTAYVNYLKKQHGSNYESKMLPQQEAKLDKLKQLAYGAQQKMASSGFSGRGGGELSLMGSSRPINIQRFTGIGPTGNYGSYGPEAMARLGVGQSLESLHPINKVKAFGWGERGSSLPGLLGAPTQPIMPTDRIAAFTKMNVRSDRISGLLGKNPTPMPTVDIKSKMRRIMNKKY